MVLTSDRCINEIYNVRLMSVYELFNAPLWVEVRGHRMKNVPFLSVDAVDLLKSESEFGNQLWCVVEKMSSVTTLC